jgi:hypothetical protein
MTIGQDTTAQDRAQDARTELLERNPGLVGAFDQGRQAMSDMLRDRGVIVTDRDRTMLATMLLDIAPARSAAHVEAGVVSQEVADAACLYLSDVAILFCGDAT